MVYCIFYVLLFPYSSGSPSSTQTVGALANTCKRPIVVVKNVFTIAVLFWLVCRSLKTTHSSTMCSSECLLIILITIGIFLFVCICLIDTIWLIFVVHMLTIWIQCCLQEYRQAEEFDDIESLQHRGKPRDPPPVVVADPFFQFCSLCHCT